jgi:hypothetical protein
MKIRKMIPWLAAASVLTACSPALDEYVFCIDRDNDGAVEEYILTDGELKKVSFENMDSHKVDDPELKYVISEVYNNITSNNVSLPLLDIALGPDYSEEEMEIISNLEYALISDYILEILEK